MISREQLHAAFGPYLDDIDLCRQAGAWWCLLHVVLCMPDICAALQSDTGGTNGARYKGWCDKYISRPELSSNEIYRMRCAVLHQGRAKPVNPGRYHGFAFGHPTSGFTDHLRLDGGRLHVDVARLTDEMPASIDRWIVDIAASPSDAPAKHVAANLPALIRVEQVKVPFVAGNGVAGQPLVVTMSKTN